MGKLQEYPEVNGFYRHYKGGLYKVLFLAKHSDNDEPLVIYQSIQFGSYHARPLKQWFEKVDGGAIATPLPRFALVIDKLPE